MNDLPGIAFDAAMAYQKTEDASICPGCPHGMHEGPCGAVIDWTPGKFPNNPSWEWKYCECVKPNVQNTTPSKA